MPLSEINFKYIPLHLELLLAYLGWFDLFQIFENFRWLLPQKVLFSQYFFLFSSNLSFFENNCWNFGLLLQYLYIFFIFLGRGGGPSRPSQGRGSKTIKIICIGHIDFYKNFESSVFIIIYNFLIFMDLWLQNSIWY